MERESKVEFAPLYSDFSKTAAGNPLLLPFI
jgi:hypothetical protein